MFKDWTGLKLAPRILNESSETCRLNFASFIATIQITN